jgi:ubiquinone/menaquinone biosynthesis C-methylase UbiE
MIKIKLTKEKIQRIKDFLNSPEYKNNIIKSELWKHESNLSKVEFKENNEIILKGSGGLYFRKINPLKKVLSNFKYRLLNFKNNLPLFPSHKAAFDSIMKDNKSRGEFEYDFNSRTEHTLFKDYSYLRNNSPFKNFDFDYFEIKHFFLFNILRSKINFDKLDAILEIGGGSGHFSILFKNYHKNIKNFISIDLPEIIIFNIIFMMHFFPEDTFCLPNEVNKEIIATKKSNFIFITPNQLSLIPDNTVDVSINTSSFAEMNPEDINNYFNLVQRVTKNMGYFLNHNRVHKLPEPHSDKGGIIRQELKANIFGNYPFNKENDILIYDICRFSQLLKIDPMMVRLEKIKKF